MANTYSQIFLHFVFVVEHRKSMIDVDWEENLYRYITGIIQNKGHKLIAINGMPDHLHIFVGYKPTDPITELVKVIKAESSKWINETIKPKSKFTWQMEYGVFSYGNSQVKTISNYIKNQKKHHLLKSFRDEYTQLLKKFDVEYNEKYLFKEV